jgi:hypothetical protein
VQAINLTVMLALSTIASNQAHSTKNMMQKTKQLLDYLATHLDATVQFHTLDMRYDFEHPIRHIVFI